MKDNQPKKSIMHKYAIATFIFAILCHFSWIFAVLQLLNNPKVTPDNFYEIKLWILDIFLILLAIFFFPFMVYNFAQTLIYNLYFYLEKIKEYNKNDPETAKKFVDDNKNRIKKVQIFLTKVFWFMKNRLIQKWNENLIDLKN